MPFWLQVSDEEFAVTLQRLQTYEEGIERVQKAGTKQVRLSCLARGWWLGGPSQGGLTVGKVKR